MTVKEKDVKIFDSTSVLNLLVIFIKLLTNIGVYVALAPSNTHRKLNNLKL